MHGVVDGVQVVLLGQLGQLELAQGGAVLGLDPHLQVLLGGVGHHLAQQLCELGGVLGLLIVIVFISFGVRFCASSIIQYISLKLRPRIKARASPLLFAVFNYIVVNNIYGRIICIAM